MQNSEKNPHDFVGIFLVGSCSRELMERDWILLRARMEKLSPYAVPSTSDRKMEP